MAHCQQIKHSHGNTLRTERSSNHAAQLPTHTLERLCAQLGLQELDSLQPS